MLDVHPRIDPVPLDRCREAEQDGRRLQAAVAADVQRWLYLELEPCGPHFGYLPVLADARKLIDDKPTDHRDQLRALIVYGFRHPVQERDGFPNKYQEMSR